MSAADRFSGRLVSAYSVTQPAAVGYAQHARHQAADETHTTTDAHPRDDGSPGGWQPPVWDTMPGQAVLRGGTGGEGSTPHRRNATHDGDQGRGDAYPSRPIPNDVRYDGGPAGQTPLLGAGGAANGGLRARGSLPWMSPGVSRRRADGGTVTRAPGFRMGIGYKPAHGEHRQNLHFNRPTLRGVRERIPTRGRDAMIRTNGPLVPTNRRQLAPFTGTTATESGEPAAPSVIGTEWVQ